MSETILAFKSQLSIVMETVLKAAMFEITRLAEVSFLEEVMRGRQEVEALKQRLHRSERRLMGREEGSRGRCGECGRATAPRQEGLHPGFEDGREVKEERKAEGNPCVWEVPDSPPPGVPQEVPQRVATPTRTTDRGAAEIITIDLEEDQTDSPDSAEDQKETTCPRDGDGLRGQPSQETEAIPWGQEQVWDLGFAAPQGGQWGTWGAPANLKPRPQHQAPPFNPEFPSPGPAESASVLERGGNQAIPSQVGGARVKVEDVPSESGSLKQEEEVEDVPSAYRTQTEPVAAHPPHAEQAEGRGLMPPAAGLPRMVVVAPEDPPPPNDPAGEQGRSLSCPHCGKTFSQLRNLKDHQRYHTGNKVHACVHCGKGFVYMCHLKVHLQSHMGERPYACPQCGKSFTYLCNLKSHQQYHSGERPFGCGQCSKSFRHLSHLKKHRFMHTGERPHRCADCGKRFAASGHLKRHQRIHTR